MRDLELQALELLKQNNITGFKKNWGVYGIINGMKVEWCTVDNCLKVGIDNSKEDVQLIKESLAIWGFECNGKGSGTARIKNPSIQDYEKFIQWALDFSIELTKPITAKSVRGKIEKQDLEVVCVSNLIANRVKYAVDNQDPGVLSRDLMDSVDGQAIIAQSVNYKNGLGERYREHAVPCDLIYREAVVMYEEGKPLYEISAMIKQYLIIVLITKEEADLLDNKLGLKTEMPEDWKLGDSPFARFNFAGIELTNI